MFYGKIYKKIFKVYYSQTEYFVVQQTTLDFIRTSYNWHLHFICVYRIIDFLLSLYTQSPIAPDLYSDLIITESRFYCNFSFRFAGPDKAIEYITRDILKINRSVSFRCIYISNSKGAQKYHNFKWVWADMKCNKLNMIYIPTTRYEL